MVYSLHTTYKVIKSISHSEVVFIHLPKTESDVQFEMKQAQLATATCY